MTSNKYRQANEHIRLSETQKSQILENILSADIQPVRKRRSMPSYGWAGLLAGAFALILLIILPMRPKTGEAPSYQAVQENASEDSAFYEEMTPTEGEAEAVMSAEYEEAPEASFEVIRFEEVEGVESADYEMINAETMEITLHTAEGDVLVYARPDRPEEYKMGADDFTLLVRDGICYEIQEDSMDPEMASRLKAAIQGE